MVTVRSGAPLSTSFDWPADVDLEHRLANFLEGKHIPERESVRFEAHGGTVVIRGSVKSANARLLCSACCRHVAGVVKLIDMLELTSRANDASRAA